jgi:hypothetical protein
MIAREIAPSTSVRRFIGKRRLCNAVPPGDGESWTYAADPQAARVTTARMRSPRL